MNVGIDAVMAPLVCIIGEGRKNRNKGVFFASLNPLPSVWPQRAVVSNSTIRSGSTGLRTQRLDVIGVRGFSGQDSFHEAVVFRSQRP